MPSGDAGDDQQAVGEGEGGFEAVKVAHILIVDEQVYEGAQLASFVEEVLLEGGVLAGEVGEGVADFAAGDGNFGFAARVGAEGGGDAEGGHRKLL